VATEAGNDRAADSRSGRIFYELHLEERVSVDHLLCLVDVFAAAASS